MDSSKISSILDKAQTVLIIQADNPDADSLASSLALEEILEDMGKQTHLYCSIDMPEYLKYLQGWDRVSKELPSTFDASIIVDTSSATLLEKIREGGMDFWISARPVIVLDHHLEVSQPITYATVLINDISSVSTGEVIYKIAKQIKWPMNIRAMEFIMTSILADSMGLVTENTTAETYRIMAELVDSGVNRPKLEEQRRAFNKMPEVIFAFKAELIERTKLDSGIALVTISQKEINEYSPLYNPAPLIQGDHLQIEGIRISIVLKQYDSGRVTGAIRCNQGTPIAAKLAEALGGGGHAYAAGFKIENVNINVIKVECRDLAVRLMKEYDETL